MPDHIMNLSEPRRRLAVRADIGARLTSTIGYERRTISFFIRRREKVYRLRAATAPPVPTYYPRMKKVNAEGPTILGSCRALPAYRRKRSREAIGKMGNQLVDVRTMLAFGGGPHCRRADIAAHRFSRSGPAGCSIRKTDPACSRKRRRPGKCFTAICPHRLHQKFAGY